MAFVVAFEGIDGAGKGTQACRLTERLSDTGASVELISFPRYESTLFGKAIGEFLNGAFGQLDEVHPFLASLLYAGDRFESLPVLRKAMADNDFVILDRYTASNVAHQGAKLDGPKRADLIECIEQIEFEIYGLPAADLVILLDVDSKQARELIARKATRTYTDDEADLQESDTDYLERVREVYLELARSRQNWRVIECLKNNVLRSIEELSDAVAAAVETAAAK